MIEILTDLEFEEKTKTGNWIVDFYAEWCGPCKTLKPIFEELSKEYAGKINFGKLDVDESPETAKKFNVMGIPTLIFLKDGAEINRSVGALSKESLKEKINETFF